MNLLLTLLLAHLLADFPLQTNGLAKLKRSSFIGVFLHVCIYVAVSAILLRNPVLFWPLLMGLGIAHFLIDGLKLLCTMKNEVLCFVIDQLLHFFTIGSATYLAHQLWAPVPVGILMTTFLAITVTVASALGIMVFCWVWVNNLGDDLGRHSSLMQWTKQQMLVCEQRIGMVLVTLVFVEQLVNRW